MPANPANPEEGLDAATEGPVSGAPEHMLQLRIVPVGPLGVKEELDESRRLVVKYGPYMQVVNGMLGSNAGNMHRLGELLRDAVDGSAQGQFAEAIQAASTQGYQAGYSDAQTDSAPTIETQKGIIEALEEAAKGFAENEKALQDQLSSYTEELKAAVGRIAELEKEQPTLPVHIDKSLRGLVLVEVNDKGIHVTEAPAKSVESK